MARIVRKLMKIFAGSATNNGQFGSAQTGDKLYSNDPDVIQALEAWDNGWDDATISGQRLVPQPELQAIQYVQTRQIAYLLQEGVPEYDEDTEYHHYSIVKKANSYQLYGSAVDNNTGNLLTDATKWSFLIDLAGGGFLRGMIMMWDAAQGAIPAGWNSCDGTMGTPNMIDKFPVAAITIESGVAKTNLTGVLTSTGGFISATTNAAGGHSHSITVDGTTLTLQQIPPHAHGVNQYSGGNGGNFGSEPFEEAGFTGGTITASAGGGMPHAHSASSGTSGSHTHNVSTIPPYYAAIFMMKL